STVSSGAAGLSSLVSAGPRETARGGRGRTRGERSRREAAARRRHQRGAPFDGLGYLGLKRIDRQIEGGGDGGETDLAAMTGEEDVVSGCLLGGLAIGGTVLTHGTLSKMCRD